MKSYKFSETIRPVIFGMNDALVSEVALVAGLSGAFLSSNIILLAGITEAAAGAISMSVGTYISSKSKVEYYEGEINEEKKNILLNAKLVRKEIEKIYKRKGFKGKALKNIVSIICSNKKHCLRELVEGDLGLVKKRFDKPKKEAVAMGVSYALSSMFPLIPFFFISSQGMLTQKLALILSLLITATVLFFAGVYKTKFTGRSWLKSGFEMVVIGLITSAIGYLIGSLISSI
ncbi:VIT1/CCC1 transporter family protein [Candidatus Woesearchaeota archaeon]|nr:VIT1/CCC1 transporter family protein [Candidatus Woesearchaeota archaeon]